MPMPILAPVLSPSLSEVVIVEGVELGALCEGFDRTVTAASVTWLEVFAEADATLNGVEALDSDFETLFELTSEASEVLDV